MTEPKDKDWLLREFKNASDLYDLLPVWARPIITRSPVFGKKKDD